jgi:hypothetical protein
MASMVGTCNVDNEMAVTFDQELSCQDVMMVAPAMTQRVISIDVQLSGGGESLLHVTCPVEICWRPKHTDIIRRGYQ